MLTFPSAAGPVRPPKPCFQRSQLSQREVLSLAEVTEPGCVWPPACPCRGAARRGWARLTASVPLLGWGGTEGSLPEKAGAALKAVLNGAFHHLICEGLRTQVSRVTI